MRRLLRALLARLGKRDDRVAAVFGTDAEACRALVVHLRQGAPGVPIWLFSTVEPPAGVAALCERIWVRGGPLALLLRAEVDLWRRWVAISAASWSGQPESPLLKLAPLLVPPFRAVFRNRSGDFFAGTPSNVLLHCRRLLRDAVHSGANGMRDVVRAAWVLVTYHLWRSGMWNRIKDVTRAWRLLFTYHIWRSGAWNRIRDVGRACRLIVTYHIWRSGPCTRAKDVGTAGLLWVSATLLKCCGYPDRRLFHRLHGRRPLVTPYLPAVSHGMAWYRDVGTTWDGAAFEGFLRSSDVRWVVWSASCGDPGESAIRLLEDECTFAVSHQMHFRGWKQQVVPTSPFRALEAGEAAEVLAPLSHTIVFDRAKLLALGVPRCSLAWTAWMLLFWKAAAAGWRSYAGGAGGEVCREREFPHQERAFIFGVLSNPELRRLGPRDASLSRGTIAFVPRKRSDARGRGDRLKVLVASPFLPYPLTHGGAVRMFNLYRALADRVDFALVAVRESHEAVPYGKLHEVFREVRVVDLDERASRDRRLPAQVRQQQSRSLAGAVARLAREWRPDLLDVDTHLAWLRDSAPDVPSVLMEHDLTFALYRQVAEAYPGRRAEREYRRWLDYERRWLREYDAVWTVSEDDRLAAIREGSHPDRTFAVPNGVDVRRFRPSQAAGGAPEILFVGSFRHFPNMLAFERLRREVMPRVWSRFPEAVVRVVAGPEHERYWRTFARGTGPLPGDGRIEIHGFVEDLRPLYAGATVVAVPLEVSAGTNIKVLEAMACGKATVSTPVGCAGLGLDDGGDILVRDEWAEFAGAICDVLADGRLCARLGAEARRTAEQRYSWDAIAETAYESYLKVAQWPAVSAAAD